ncbi:MAG: lipocalin family protein [Solirubrobacteraceae bacterium]|nr:lipocalin family protein [Solirubrobacteraceae bacterium]
MSSRRLSSILSAVAIATGLGAAASPAGATAVTPIPSLDTQRYTGEWRQIASLPQWFEAFCISDTVASYALNDDGTVRVSNRCVGPFGANIVTRGRARILDPVTNAQLQVTFVPNGSGGWSYPSNEPNYIVIGIGAAYDWAVVGDPQRTSAFVLSRTPALSAAQRTSVRQVLDANGFDPCKLKTTRQRGGIQKVVGFCQV